MPFWLAAARRTTRRPSSRPSARPAVEALESRLVPYGLSGNAWPNPQLITISFVPDGTVLAQDGNGGYITSNLISAFNAKFHSTPAAWQNVILKAAQTWAAQTDINFALATDDGSNSGSGAYQQGASRFGDIRIGGYDFGSNSLAATFYPPSANNYSIAGDVDFNTGANFNIGSTFDLYTVALHEIGHALGLAHSTSSSAVMYSVYNGVHSSVSTDDAAGIRAIYSGGKTRDHDAYSGANNTFATAGAVSGTINASALTSVVNNLDLTAVGQVEYFTFTAPTGSAGSMTVTVQSTGLSLLTPKLSVFDAGQNLLGSATFSLASGATQNGATLSVTVSDVKEGAVYYVKVQGADSTLFSTGQYALALNLGTGANPTVTPPNTQVANGNPLTGGSGIPMDPSKVSAEVAPALLGADTNLSTGGTPSPTEGDPRPQAGTYTAPADAPPPAQDPTGSPQDGTGPAPDGAPPVTGGNVAFLEVAVTPDGSGVGGSVSLPPLMCNCPACRAAAAAMMRAATDARLAALHAKGTPTRPPESHREEHSTPPVHAVLLTTPAGAKTAPVAPSGAPTLLGPWDGMPMGASSEGDQPPGGTGVQAPGDHPVAWANLAVAPDLVATLLRTATQGGDSVSFSARLEEHRGSDDYFADPGWVRDLLG